MTRRWLRHASLGWVLLWAGALLLTGCGTMPLRSDGGPSRPVDVAAIPNAVPRVEPLSRFGNPSSYVVYGRRYYVMASSEGFVQRGIASWYGTKFYGRRTASGEPYNMYAMTAAHRTLPIPTFIRVTNLRNHRWVIVRVNDRGPFARNRILDLSWAAAAKLGMLGQGTAPVEIRAIDPRHPPARPQITEQPALPVRIAAAEPDPPAQPARHEPSHIAPGDTHHGPYYLQVGAFTNRGNAERLRARLVKANLSDVEILSSYRHRVRLYRVRIGPLETVREADHMAHTLLRYGVRQPQLVAD